MTITQPLEHRINQLTYQLRRATDGQYNNHRICLRYTTFIILQKLQPTCNRALLSTTTTTIPTINSPQGTVVWIWIAKLHRILRQNRQWSWERSPAAKLQKCSLCDKSMILISQLTVNIV